MTQTQSSEPSKPKNRFGQIPFITAVVILAVGAAILNFADINLGLYFKKQAVPQAREFSELPPIMGKWIQVSQDAKLDPQTEEVLATGHYIYRDYIQVDQRGADLLTYFNEVKIKSSGTTQPSVDAKESDNQIAGDFEKASFDDRVAMIQAATKDKTAAELSEAVTALQLKKDGGVVDMGLTYYTGLVDTVAHIPDRCYIAAGYEPAQHDTLTWDMDKDKGEKLDVSFISFDDVSGSNLVPKCVAYVFHCNGQFESDPISVRRTLESLTERYGYYAKIELMTIVNDGRVTDTAKSTMADFLASAKPQIETCFPDWSKLKHSK